eukprot:2553256-Pyramimonas_sp.AAC.1
MVRRWPKRAPNGAQDGLQRTPRGPQQANCRPLMGSGTVIENPRSLINGLQDGLKRAHTMAPRGFPSVTACCYKSLIRPVRL